MWPLPVFLHPKYWPLIGVVSLSAENIKWTFLGLGFRVRAFGV